MTTSPLTVASGPLLAADAASSRVVYGVVITLLVIGVVLIGLGIWVIRQTRVDPQLLAPLERMDDRRWRKLDPVRRRRVLDEVRPEGAEPVKRMPSQPAVDREFDADPPVPSFDDLVGTATTTAPLVRDPELLDEEAAADTVGPVDVGDEPLVRDPELLDEEAAADTVGPVDAGDEPVGGGIAPVASPDPDDGPSEPVDVEPGDEQQADPGDGLDVEPLHERGDAPDDDAADASGGDGPVGEPDASDDDR